MNEYIDRSISVGVVWVASIPMHTIIRSFILVVSVPSSLTFHTRGICTTRGRAWKRIRPCPRGGDKRVHFGLASVPS